MWRLDLDRPTELGCEADPSTHILSVHLTPGLHFEAFVDGRHAYGRTSSVGTVNLVRAGEQPRAVIAPCSKAVVLHLYVPDALVQACVEEAGEARREAVELIDPAVERDPTLERVGQLVVSEMQRREMPSRLLLEAFGIEAATQLVRRWSNLGAPAERRSGGLPPAVLRRLRDLIETRLADDLSMAELAAEAGLSASHFREAFAQATGASPSRYVAERRIERAKGLLAREAGLAEIALACGFADQSHLTRRFREATGLTPKAWRDQLA
ncbi:MAG: helix-turn-helix transcriptional regulator [Pseudomonadota bacterium]